MKTPKKLPSECDYWCTFRRCLQKDYDRGFYVPDIGQVHWFKKPIYVCKTRLVEGCPEGPIDGRPLPDWNMIREFITTSKPKKLRELSLRLLNLCEGSWTYTSKEE